MSESTKRPKVVVLTGGAWWDGSCEQFQRMECHGETENHTLGFLSASECGQSAVSIKVASAYNFVYLPAIVQGHYFVKEAVKNASKGDRPLRLYMCTRKPPPNGELERFVDAQWESALTGSEASPPWIVNNVSLRHLPLDLLDPLSIRNCASRFLSKEARLDVLVLNAAIAPNKREPSRQMVRSLQSTSSDQPLDEDLELEQAMMTNVIGTSALTRLLQPALLKAAEDMASGGEKPRVALVSSELHRRLGDIEVTPQTIQKLLSVDEWNGMRAYKLTKLVQWVPSKISEETYLSSDMNRTIWLYALQRELGDAVNCVAISPGFIPSTSLSRASSYSARLFMSYFLHFMPFASTVDDGGRKVYQGSMQAVEGCDKDDTPREAIYLKDNKPVLADHRVYDERLGEDWKRWIEHATATLSTPIAALLPASPNVLVVGGTAGIGAALATKLARQLPINSQVTIAGRNGDAAAHIMANARRQAKFAVQDDDEAQQASLHFGKVDCASMSDVKRFCEQYRHQLQKRDASLDILILTPGILSIKGRTPTKPNSTIDQKMALHYYSRMLIIRELGPVLSKNVIVMSVLDGKYSNAHDQAVIWDDLALSRPGHYGLRSARTHGNAMTDVMMQYFASYPSVDSEEGGSPTFLHAYPGFVSTTTFDNPALPFIIRIGLRLLMKMFATSPDECADRLVEGMVKAHRSTMASAGLGGRWYGLDRQNIVTKRPVESAVVERIRAHTWQVVDEQPPGA